MRRLAAVFCTLFLALAGVVLHASAAPAASRQICYTLTRSYQGWTVHPARVCVNYIPAINPPTTYYLVESMRVWNPCDPFTWEQYAIMQFWATDGTHYSVYTGAIACGHTYIKTWPTPRVDNAKYVYFTVDDVPETPHCVSMRPATWQHSQDIFESSYCLS